MADASPELAELTRAGAGLLYPSESDEPFEVFCWPATGAARQQVAAHAQGEMVEISVDEFFAPLADADDADRFANLRRALETRLTGLQVLRVGKVNVEIFLIGRTPAGEWAGLRTLAVET